MKKLVIFMVLACSAISMSAQDGMYGGNTQKKEKEKKAHIWGTRKLKIETDKQKEDGERYISTSIAVYAHSRKFLDEKYEAFYLARFTSKDMSEDDALYLLSFHMSTNTRLNMDENSRLIVKLSDGEVLTFFLSGEVGFFDNKANVYGSSTWYNSRPSYKIKSSDVKKMIEGDVTKLRMETNLGYIDFDKEKYSKWLFSDVLKQCYDLIQEKAQKSNDLYEGF